VNPGRIRWLGGRRALALAAAGLVASATLAACGFDYPTDRINNLTAGVDYRDGTVEILNAVVVADQANSGTFVATFVNDSTNRSVSLQSVSGDNTAIANADASPFTLQPGSLRNLAADGGIPVSGTFASGQFVNLSFQFDDGETADLTVPVVQASGQWAGLDTATPSASPGSASSEASATATATPTDAAS
jgi:hypothetical protein